MSFKALQEKAFDILGELTPLKADCGRLCGGACCKGDAQTGMRLFPFEETSLSVVEAADGFACVTAPVTVLHDRWPAVSFRFFRRWMKKGGCLWSLTTAPRGCARW